MRAWVMQLAHLTALLAPLLFGDNHMVLAYQGFSIWHEILPDLSTIELLELSLMQENNNTRCSHDCFEHLGRGYCVDGICECTKHYIGEDCSNERTNCPSDCSFNGVCRDGDCMCNSGWSGEDCSSFQQCPRDCSERGICVNGNCACDEGFLGEDCSKIIPSMCPASCFGRGTCVDGRCHCDRGYSGSSCSIVQLCVESRPADFTLCAALLHDPRDKYYITTGFDIAGAEQRVLEESRMVNDTCTGKSLGREMALNILCARHIPFCHPRTQTEVKACLGECDEAAKMCGFEVSEFCPSSRFFDGSEGSFPPYDFYHQPKKHQPKCKEIYLPGDKSCPNDCSHHGRCDTQDGVCLCDHKWKGIDCSVPDCPRNCSGHGLCLGDPTPGVCRCDTDWTLEDCSLKKCPNDCSGVSHGRCNNGTCNCLNPWSSVDCSIPVCPNNCSYHGDCLSKPPGVCKCDPGFFGEDCSKRKCPNDCSGHGHCDTSTGLCACDVPWTKEDCSLAICPSNCSGHGICQQSRANAGKCLCDTFWHSEDCSMKSCPQNCSDNGVCDHTTGMCDCNDLYYAEDCSKKHCPNDCFDTHGICHDNGTCDCFNPWGNADCGTAMCPNNCSSHGECLQTTEDAGKCYCSFPWSTLDCSVARCPNDCSNHGECLQTEPDHGKCACEEPWIGSDCSLSLCPNGCSGHGRCLDGKCFCFNPWFTEDCSVAMCPDNCTSANNGLCDPGTGVCSCFEPFTGINCSYALCPDDCSHNGYCDRATGYCTCDTPWYGDSCSMQPCPRDCSGHGECNTANGHCLCDEFWYGEACDQEVPSLSPGASTSVTPSISSSVGASPSTEPSETTRTTAEPSTTVISTSSSLTASLSVGSSVSESVSETPGVTASQTPSQASSRTPSPSITQSLGATPSTDIRCSHDCSGHGECNTGTGICTCDTKWSDEDCSVPLCEYDCNSRGRCVEPDLCICEEGFDGDLCQLTLCKNNCTGHGLCDLETGVCDCDEGWRDEDCSEKICPNDCSGNGECVDGDCRCESGWTSEDCSVKECPNNCTNHGACDDGVCICDAPFQGDDCSEIPLGELPEPGCDCSGHGACEIGVCKCDPGFSGPTCSDIECAPPCQNEGVCDLNTGNCTCPEPFYGDGCSLRGCENCARGVCQPNGTCLCDSGYFGPSCDEFSCSEDCNNRGVCTAPDVCECMEGWQGFNCSDPICPGDPECSGHGKCLGPGKCECEIGWTGNACEERVPCPNDCSGHGVCEDGICLCEPDWMGADCSVHEERSCKDVEEGCGGYGVCTCEGKCECMPGFVGRLCQRPARCKDGCSGRGQCIQDQVCKCYEGFTGKTCNVDTAAKSLVISGCPNGCSGQGYCGATGECSCFVGFDGTDCTTVQATECPNSCSDNGLCEMYEDSSTPECVCSQGWTGTACDEFDEICPKNCSCNGVCINDQCVCNSGYYGAMCELRACPNDCSNHGECENGTCKCNQPWYEFDCSVAMCPYNCSKQGVCDKSTGVCTCDPGYYGDDCASLICPGTPECSDHGVCEVRTGVCDCHMGWHGEACECKACPLNCTSRGECDCDTGTCTCELPYYGRACENMPCPNDCSGNGRCNNRTGKCNCDTLWKELDCSMKMCPGEDKDLICSHHGVCEDVNKTCDCDPGWAGFDCSQIARTKCPKDCSGPDHGTCVNGECVCKVDWTGPSCSIVDELCPEHEGRTCNNKGSCLRGKCFCIHGWSGESCEVAEFEECPRNCSNHGVCVNGICKCEWDWVGSACQKYRCPNGCSKHGFCNKNSTCTCDDGWEILQPDNCSEGPHFLCTPECVNGSCNHTIGGCECNEGYEGATCDVEICPKRCHLEGKCLTGVCDCNSGYISDDCGIVDMGPNFCSGKGLYNRDTGACECSEGFEGEDCSSTELEGAFDILCMTNCTALGICDGTENATCICKEGWTGVDCSERVEKCPFNCRGHGVCTKETSCFCAPMYTGNSCEGYLTGFEENDISVLGPARECPEQCAEHGVCSDTGECECYGGGHSFVQAFWAGADCLEGHCANDCSGHGTCESNYVCNCTDFWSGWACEIEPPPCSGCSGRGDCDCSERVVFGNKEQCKCDCHTGFQGINCEDVIPCPLHDRLMCGGRGVCILGECACNRGFVGQDCSETNITNAKICPAKGEAVCSGNGICLVSGECDCFPGWTANDCSVKITDCPYSCNGQGACNDNLGSCTCFEEFEHVDCSGFVNYEVALMPCQQNCTGHGMCCNGRCKCLDGWKGSSCSIPTSICPNQCSGNGICLDTNECECTEGYSGQDCSSGPIKSNSCPRNCMGNGICNPLTGRCDCLYDFEGADCSISAPRCPNNCSGNGECYAVGQGVSGGEGSICECLDGYGGFDCSIALVEDLDMTHCPANCSGHGVCLDYQCYCSQDYRGAACNYMDRKCPDSCSGFGVCEDGCCNCMEGYKGVTCGLGPDGKLPDEPVCRNNCTGHGTCNPENRRCECVDPFVYEDCSVLTEDCPGNCNGHGECLLGKCACDPGFSGAGCDTNVAEEKYISDDEGYKRGLRDSFYNKTLECPLGCSAHGSCDGETGICHCWDGWTGLGCEIGESHSIECPKNCSGHGECIDGQCSCDIGYFGVACENMNMPCPFHCSGKGICTDGECRCFEGYFGDGCESPTYAPYCAMNCTGQGECLDGDCHCPTGFRGIDCSISIGRCSHGCSGNGMCGSDDLCICSSGYSGEDCSIADSTIISGYPDCPRNCSGKGICELGACVCNPDQGHYDCGVTVFICPRGCSGQGVCVAGECQCNTGFMGEDCSRGSFQHMCPMNCSGRGECVNGFCECRFPWVGEDCSRIGVCPGDCSGHGVCEGVCGSCSCFSDWGGTDCSVQGGCPNDCSGNGNCTGGICVCDSLFTGPDCGAGKDLIDLCNALHHIVPDFLGVECDGLDETNIITAVSNKWDTEPADEHAARIFRAMQQGPCSDRVWRLRNRIVLITRRIHSHTPSALTRYEDIKENSMDICYIHSLFEPRMLLYETRDDPKVPAFAANDITMLIQECNTYLAELFETPKRDELRRLRDKIKKFAIDITNLDPNVLNFESLTIDELLCHLADHGNAAMLMSKAADSIAGVVEISGHMLLSIGAANDFLGYAKNHVSEAIDEIYSLGLFSKYFSEVLDLIGDSQKFALADPPGVGALAQLRRSSNPIVMIEIASLDTGVKHAASGEWVEVEGNKLLDVGTPFPTYDLQFEVEILQGGSNFGSILQIGDGDSANSNTRCPGFQMDDVVNGMMGVSVMNVDGELKKCQAQLSVGIHKIGAHVTTSGMKVTVDGADACSVVSKVSCPLTNAAIYAGHPGLSLSAARVRNIVYAPLVGADAVGDSESNEIATKNDAPEQSSVILPHSLDLPSLIVTMVEENTGEKARDAVFGQPEDSPERLAVIKLIAGLNIASSRGVSEMPDLSVLFETRSKIKMFTVTLYKLDPASIDNPIPLTPDEITNLLVNPETKAKLRQLQLQPALYKTVSLLLHEINKYQSFQSFMVAEAKRIAFILRALDETIVPDLSSLSDTQVATQEVSKNTKVVNLSKAANYIDSLEVYLQTADLDKSAELQNDVAQFLELMKALGGALPFSAVSFLDLFAQRLILIDMYNLLVEHAGLAEMSIAIESSTTIEIVDAMKIPLYLEQIRQIAENVPSPEDVSTEEYNKAVESSKIAEQLLLALEAIDQNSFDAIALLKIIGEGLNRISSAAGKGVVFPDPTGKQPLEYCSEVYDTPVWDVLRTTDSAFRMQESNSTDVESDKDELIATLKESASNGDISNWGIQVHAVVDLVTGLLGIGDTEVLIREALIHMSEAEKILRDFKQVHPETFDELRGLVRPASLIGKYEKGETAVFQGTNPPTLSLTLNQLEVEGLPASFKPYCPNCAANVPLTLVEGSFCHHYGIAPDPLYHETLGPRATHDSSGLAVRCCTEEGEAVHTDQSGGCFESLTYMQAVGACRANGFRLCSLEELQDGRSIGMGCGFDRRRVWTSTSVGSCEAESTGSEAYSQDSIHADFTIKHQAIIDPVTGQPAVDKQKQNSGTSAAKPPTRTDSQQTSSGSTVAGGTTVSGDSSGEVAEGAKEEGGAANDGEGGNSGESATSSAKRTVGTESSGGGEADEEGKLSNGESATSSAKRTVGTGASGGGEADEGGKLSNGESATSSAKQTNGTTSTSPRPDSTTNPVDDPYLLAKLEALLSRVAELSSILRTLVVAPVVAIRESHPESVPSIVGIDIPPDGKLVMETLATKDAVLTMIRSLDEIPHGEARVDLNNAIQIVKLFSSGFTDMMTVPPGEESLATMDYNSVPLSECSNSGTKFDGQCICNGYTTGTKCEQTNSWDQAYQDGWRQGWKASLSNITEYSSPGDLVLNAATAFDRAAQQLKTTAMAMARIDLQCEIRVPTSYLSALEIMRNIEDSGWLEEYRSCANSQFKAVIPKLLKEAALVRREYDDIATMVKHLILKASTLDCETMKMVAITSNGETPVCGAVAQTITTTDKAQVLEKCMTAPVMMEFENMLRMEHSAAMKHVVDDTLELVNAIQRHTQCPNQCSKRGFCILRVCQCFEGWTGEACTHEAPLPDGMCPRNCSYHGKCSDGKCKCDPGWKSYDCSFSTACPNNCYDHGDCIDGQCHCFRRWRGFDCSLPREICPDDFNCYHGVCRNNECICEQGWTGDDCTIGDFHAKANEDGFWESDMADTAVFLQSGESGGGDASMAHPWL